MKKTLIALTALGICLNSAAMAADEPMVISPAPAYSITINGEALSQSRVFTENGKLMVPLRAVAEKLGFEVSWDAERQGVKLDDKEVNTTVYVGNDSYYMASSTAIGMSAPTALGAAPVIKDDRTYVPAEMFKILCGADAYKVSGNTIEFGENTQIPNPFTEYANINEAKKAISFEAGLPEKIPAGYEVAYVTTLSDDFLQVRYENAGKEINYRVAKGNEDISGDYNVYSDTKNVKIGDFDVTLRSGDGKISAIWTKDNLSYAVYSDGIGEQEITELIASVQ